jgi:DNA modification methylase
MGSGTTLLSAVREGFSGIGFDKNERYFLIASNRVAEELKQPYLAEALNEEASA